MALGRRILLGAVVVAAGICLALGLSLPILKVPRYVFWTDEISLLTAVRVLLRDGQYFLGLIILTFAIILPTFKLLYLLVVASLPAHLTRRHHLAALAWLGKWSMHDVLVLALAIFFIKSHGLYDAASLTGVLFFTAAVGLMLLAHHQMRKDLRDAGLPFEPETAMTSDLRRVILSFLIVAATVLFALGVTLPVIEFRTVYVWTSEHSIATVIHALYQRGGHGLGAVLLAVSIVFPFLKLFYLTVLVASPDLPASWRARLTPVLAWLGRYSMADVMMLALIVFYVNASGFIAASVLPGAYVFAASTLITMAAYGWANTASAAPAPGQGALSGSSSVQLTSRTPRP